MEGLSDTISSLTSLTRSQHIAHFMDDLGLDKRTASLMYTAQRLQEKGQLIQAFHGFRKVLDLQPDCQEALDQAHILRDILKDEERKEQTVVNQKEAKTIEMHVDWSDIENKETGYYPDPDQAAIYALNRKLLNIDYGSSPFKLLENKVLEHCCDGNTGWLKFMKGRALFEVTLIPDAPNEKETYRFESLPDALLDSKRESEPNSSPPVSVELELPTELR